MNRNFHQASQKPDPNIGVAPKVPLAAVRTWSLNGLAQCQVRVNALQGCNVFQDL